MSENYSQLPAALASPARLPQKKWFNPLFVGALILAIVLAALILHNEHRERSALHLLPLDTDAYFLAPLADTPTADRALWDKLCASFFGELSPADRAMLTASVTHYGVARLPQGEALIVKCGNAWDVKRLFTAARFAAQPSGSPNSYTLTVGGDTLAFALLKPYAVFAPNRDAVATVVDCWREGQKSLGQVAPKFHYANRAEFYARPHRSLFPDNFRELWRVASDLPENSGWFGEIEWRGDSFVAQGAVVNLLPAPPAPGFWHYLWWTFVIIVAVVIGLPVLFLLTVFGLAGWFHFTSKWRGIKSPPVVPELPPLSPELQEDLKSRVES
ncbi:hypothetical protein FACS1894139_10430 [Planctomycetales bacterium]|nr:hypothetical protein FACS1894108_04950 [Planctomycetales bacterium]GHT05847.1 hypothetical protein FACS1894139_10430 [Planctomycetales bacterium]